jgi:hypothetical protein
LFGSHHVCIGGPEKRPFEGQVQVDDGGSLCGGRGALNDGASHQLGYQLSPGEAARQEPAEDSGD